MCCDYSPVTIICHIHLLLLSSLDGKHYTFLHPFTYQWGIDTSLSRVVLTQRVKIKISCKNISNKNFRVKLKSYLKT